MNTYHVQRTFLSLAVMRFRFQARETDKGDRFIVRERNIARLKSKFILKGEDKGFVRYRSGRSVQ